MPHRKRVLGVALLIVLLSGVGTVVVLQRRPDPTPLLGNMGATLSRVAVSQETARPDKPLDATATEPGVPTVLGRGLDLGEVLRRDGNGPWYRQVIDPDRADTPYVADSEVCGGSDTVLVASGNVGTNAGEIVLLDDVTGAVPTVWRSAGGAPWSRITVNEAPQPSSLRAIVSARMIGRLDTLVAIGQQLDGSRSAYVAISDDCGTTWRTEALPDGRGTTFAEAIVVDDQGVLIVGRTGGTKPSESSLIVWRSSDPDKAASFEPTIVETNASISDSISFVTRTDESVVIALLDTRKASLLRWNGDSAASFGRLGETVDEWQSVDVAANALGPHLLSFGDAGRRLELRRFTVDATPMDPLPGINGQAFRQFRFLGTDGSTLWIIGETNDFELRAWSVTQNSTASCPEPTDGAC